MSGHLPWRLGIPAAMLLSAFALGADAAPPADAPRPGFGRLSAVSAVEPWRPPPGIRIETRDTDLDGIDGPHVEAVRETLHASLSERGIAVGPDGSHVLNFMVIIAPAPAPRDAPVVRNAPAARDAPYEPPTASYRSLDAVEQVTVPLGDQSPDDVSSHMSITFKLFVPGEAPLWHATITATGEVEDPADVLRGMTRAAMDALGKTEERTMALSCGDARGGEAKPCLP